MVEYKESAFQKCRLALRYEEHGMLSQGSCTLLWIWLVASVDHGDEEWYGHCVNTLQLILRQHSALSDIYPIGLRKCHRGKCYHSQGECCLFCETGSDWSNVSELEPCCLTHLSDLCSHIHMMIKHYADVTGTFRCWYSTISHLHTRQWYLIVMKKIWWCYDN